MKDRIIKIVSLVMVFAVITGLCSCKLNHKEVDGIMTTVRQVTLPTSGANDGDNMALAVTAVAPEGNEAIIKYFNEALRIFYEHDFEFTRTKTTKLKDYSAGTLESVSGATKSYLSTLKSACGDMMGVGSLETNFYFGDEIASFFSIKSIDGGLVNKCSASAEGSNVTVNFDYNAYSGDYNNTLRTLTDDFMNLDDFRTKIERYGAKFEKASIILSEIKLSAVIDCSTRHFVSVSIEYATTFSVSKMAFDYITGGPIKGKTNTVISYKDFKEI